MIASVLVEPEPEPEPEPVGAGGWTSQQVRAQAEAEAKVQTDYTIRLWDIHSGAALGEPMRGHSGHVQAVSFSYDGRWLASASGDKTVRVWDVATQQQSAVGPLRCQRGANTVIFSPEDGLVAAGDDSGRIYLWRTDTGEQAHEPLHAKDNVKDKRVWSVAFSPEGTRILSGGEDNVARIWDIAAGQCILVLQGHTDSVQSVAWSSDEHVIGTGSGDATLRLWDASTGAPLATLRGHVEDVTSVAFTRDAKFIVSGSKDSTIRKWDVRAACQLPAERHNNPVAALASATLKDGWLVGSSGELILWVPAEYRSCLAVLPCTLRICKSSVVIGVEDGDLHAGENWTSCWGG